MDSVLNPIPILLAFAFFYGLIGFRFFSIYWEKIWLGIMIIPLVAIEAYYYWNDLYAHFWLGMWAQFVWFSSCLLMAELHVRIRKNSVVKLQEARDRESSSLADSLDRSLETAQDFALYLRPFRVTGNIPTSLPGTHYTDSEFEGVLDFEGLLEDAMRDTTPLVALGRPMETYGAGRILTDDASWQAEVIRLMQAAKTIFIIPSNRPGTWWEVEHILHNGLTDKCVFIMPPTGAIRWTKEPDENWHYGDALVDQARDWEETSSALEALKIHLPPYEQSGALFTINPSGELQKYAPMPLLLPKFSGVGGYLEAIRTSIADLRCHALTALQPSRSQPAASKRGFFAHEAREYDLTPDGFEVKMVARTWRGWLGCGLLGFLFIFLGILSWRHRTAAFWYGLESAVAYMFVGLLQKVIRFVRE